MTASTTGDGILNHSLGFKASREFLIENMDRSTISKFFGFVTVGIVKKCEVRQMTKQS